MNKISRIFLTCAALSSSLSAFGLTYNTDRCETTTVTLSQGDALAMTKWTKKCRTFSDSLIPDSLDFSIFRGEKGEHLSFPVWFIPHTNTAWRGPEDPKTMNRITAGDCSVSIPSDYTNIVFCLSGCYAPTERLLFVDENNVPQWIPMADAFMKEKKVVALSREATFENMKYEPTEIASYMRDHIDSIQNLLEFRTASGKKLKVTENHPLLSFDGQVKTASQFQIGHGLVEQSGRRDEIVKIRKVPHFGKVYNLDTKSSDLKNKLVIAEGVVNGTSYFQNEGISKLNRILMRESVELGAN
jgi:hypothetical protein